MVTCNLAQKIEILHDSSMMKFIFTVLYLLTFLISMSMSFATSISDEIRGNRGVKNFHDAKKLAIRVHKDHQTTIYCPCTFSGKTIDLKSCGYLVHKDAKRAARLEWEHVVPAEAFGQSFKEWREGSEVCHKKSGKGFKGRKCAETNPEFQRMEADLYNLWPIVGELNGLRSNYSMAQIAGAAMTFGGCKVKIADRKFEPMDEFKGIVARDYMYMDVNYPGHGVISEKNRKLFEAWNKSYPVTQWECERAGRIKKIQGNENQILSGQCSTKFQK